MPSRTICLAASTVLILFWNAISASAAERPNVVFIMADDLGYGHVGCFGQTKIKTPEIDRLAQDGVKFTQFYAGSTVCAPSRCALMTGLHTGHCRTRGNGGLAGKPRENVPLEPQDLTVGKVFQSAGYQTACIGKWGLGEEGSVGIPTKQGFHYFFGYLNQHHAHNYYPEFLWRNEEKVRINNPQTEVDNVSAQQNVYSPDLMLAEGLRFIEQNRTKPFFLYYSMTLPHANNERTRFDGNGNEIPSDAPYTNEDWPQAEKNLAAMITRLDSEVGTIRAKLKELKIDQNTLVIFTSDNGPHTEGSNNPKFFNASAPFAGMKRSLRDGGIRVPTVAAWPGKIQPGSVSEHVCAFWDLLPTVAELVDFKMTTPTDGVSFLPTLTGQGTQKTHEFLYWEFHEGGFKQAVRHKNWKALRNEPKGKLELYNLANDLTESVDVAAEFPEVVATIETYLKTARTDSKEFPIRPVKPKTKKNEAK